jgi:uncharacterized protein (TIGR02246 family)
MAERYTSAWNSHDASAVASYYAENGSIRINGGEPIAGRPAVSDTVQGFYNDFPDLVVHLDQVRAAGNRALFLWTLEGTHSGSGNWVRISGWEAWLLSDGSLVEESMGYFDAAEYERQIAEGL